MKTKTNIPLHAFIILSSLFFFIYSCTKDDIDIPIPGIFAAISAGSNHSLALEPDGTLWAWGYNDSGQLGDGTNESTNTPVKIDTGYSLISAGEDFSLALKTDGTMWAWGNNEDGQLGDGTYVNKNSPVQIGSGYTSIKTGHSESIFFLFRYSLALKTDGTLWAWGHLGDITEVGKNLPVKIGLSYSSIAAGSDYSLALKTDGTMWSWGLINYNTHVQIGTDYIAVAAGYSHSLALKTNGTLWSWGTNLYGELGDGTNVSKYSPTEVGSDFTAITAAGTEVINIFGSTPDSNHSLALKSDGTLWAWGNNYWGQLGDGTHADKNTPVQIGTEYIAISTGPYHSLALKSDGTLWTWGFNGSGQLGDGTDIDQNIPVRISP